MPEIYAARRAAAARQVAEAGADAALITSGPNVRYLTGMCRLYAPRGASPRGPGLAR